MWWNGPADWTDPVCLDPNTKRHMERAPDGRQPSANVPRTDGVLGTLQSVGSALLESVSSNHSIGAKVLLAVQGPWRLSARADRNTLTDAYLDYTHTVILVTDGEVVRGR